VRYSALERMADRLVVGEIPSLIVSGPPGLGKSYTLKGAIDRHAGDVDDENVFGNRVMDWVGGSISSVGLYKALSACRDGGVLVLDDCDDVFRDEVSLNLLKVALDSSKERVVSWRKESTWLITDDIPDRFDFQGHVCFITNIDFEAAIQTGRRDAEHFKALIDRSMYLCLTLRTRPRLHDPHPRGRARRGRHAREALRAHAGSGRRGRRLHRAQQGALLQPQPPPVRADRHLHAQRHGRLARGRRGHQDEDAVKEYVRRYHVPYSQVWGNSRGKQHGHVHLHVVGGEIHAGRIHRRDGEALCKRRGWFEREPEVFELADMCPRCVALAERLAEEA
jgi:hypothetical protein